jgi:hypothetical protein
LPFEPLEQRTNEFQIISVKGLRSKQSNNSCEFAVGKHRLQISVPETVWIADPTEPRPHFWPRAKFCDRMLINELQRPERDNYRFFSHGISQGQ